VRRILIGTAFLLLAATAARAQQDGSPAPLVDHHQHLLSPATAALWAQPGLPAVELPAEFTRLLALRDSAFGDSAALTRIYAEDAFIFGNPGISGPVFRRGRAAVASYLATIFGRPYRVTPVEVRVEGTTARIGGYVTRGEADDPRHFGHVVLSLRREGDGAWRITTETLSFPGPEMNGPLTADSLVVLLDEARIQRALVLSVAYSHARGPREQAADENARVRAENDWTAQQVARFPDRLRAFCGINPLRPWALEEIERCDRDPHLSGIKMHFGNSGVDLRDPAHVERVRRVFQAANERRMPIVAHVRASFSLRIPYGREAAEVFLNQVLPAAPDIPIQIAHMAGSGPGWGDAPADSALAVFAEAVSAGDPRTRNLWFDLTTVVNLAMSRETARHVAGRIRQLGVQRVLYGSDMALSGNLPPRQGWAVIRGLLPLTDDEFRTIATNVAPYMR
jgi:predicted TIM-barrel fold metal-dependent hydrolase